MNLNLFDKYYFIGIGGIGMSALARYFHAKGYLICGYDKTPTKLTLELQNEGISVHYDEKHIPKEILKSEKHSLLIVYTPAVSPENFQLAFFNSSKWILLKRSELLGLVTQNSYTIAVSGTHGKTTTSCLLAHILKSCQIDCTAFLGGISTNFNSNLILSKRGNIVVVEADEYDKSFLKLSPDVSIITSVDPDHLDIYNDEIDLRETFKLFASILKEDGLLLLNQSVDLEIESKANSKKMTYSATKRADNTAYNLKIENGIQKFDVNIKDLLPGQVFEYDLHDILLSLPGKHNVENALAAIVVASYLGAKPNNIKNAVSSFKGVKRRFELHSKGKHVYIDDYAHHPKELKATLQTTRKLFPSKKITAVFQPHLYSRTRDFAIEFGESLSLADEVLLLDIYPARELPIEGIDSKMLLQKIKNSNKHLLQKEKLIEELIHPKREVLLTLGAGDIDQFVEPLTKHYQNEVD